jgi:hypothetical protein
MLVALQRGQFRPVKVLGNLQKPRGGFVINRQGAGNDLLRNSGPLAASVLSRRKTSMKGKTVAEPPPIQEATGPDSDRRRPGRRAYEAPELVKLLRGTASEELGLAAEVPRTEGEAGRNNAIGQRDNGLNTLRGILEAVPLSLVCWIIIGAVVWFF